MKFGISKICSAFEDQAIGSRVLNRGGFLAALEIAVSDHASNKVDWVLGQHTVSMPESVNSLVSSGVGLCAGVTPDDFVLREHRGVVSAYLRRDRAIQPHEDIKVIVYTAAAYVADPEVDPSEFEGSDVSHVIVAVLAGSSPLTPARFVSNLAGGNMEAVLWGLEEVTDKSKEIDGYWKKWRVVAD